MLKAYVCGEGRVNEVDLAAVPDKISSVTWLDLESPSPEEIALVVKATGLILPEESDIVEIENSSRLAVEGEVLTLTMPVVARLPTGLEGSSCGFVLSPRWLVTIRFVPSLAFNGFVDHAHETGKPDAAHSAFIFVGLLEAFADRQADALEQLRTELDAFSRKVFGQHEKQAAAKGKRARNEEAELRDMLVTLGRAYDTISFLRDSQLGVARIAPYVSTSAPWLPKPVDKRLKTLQTDIASLNEFSVHLTDKVQFLLDATLGLINIAQSTLMKVFTVVAVIGIPPTLMAGVYGMNFHDMPELSWKYGYAYGWAVIILSAMLPLVWFRRKGWL